MNRSYPALGAIALAFATPLAAATDDVLPTRGDERVDHECEGG